MSKEKEFKSGFVSLVGRPNVGKSTLMNKLVGHKIAIMSDKPQTTRHKIHSVLTGEDYQIIFLDTPGIHKPKHKLGQHLVELALGSLGEVDLILFLCEAMEPGAGDKYIIRQLEGISTPVILVLNKIDLIPKPQVLALIDEYRKLYDFDQIIPVSALKEENLDRLIQLIMGYLEPGPKFYPDGMYTDKPERFIMAELIREKVLHLTSQEIPHSVIVEIEDIEKMSDEMLEVRAIIYVERDSQKGIIIGKNGSMLQEIGKRARQEMEALLGSRIYLELFVKVKSDWRNNEKFLRGFGFYE
ncbi:MAG: GTPase Era [Peptococcaceae bacterium]|nr:GTPase Era [Peptococcaceae bacterium]